MTTISGPQDSVSDVFFPVPESAPLTENPQINFTASVTAGPLELGMRLGEVQSIVAVAGLTDKEYSQPDTPKFHLKLNVGPGSLRP